MKICSTLCVRNRRSIVLAMFLALLPQIASASTAEPDQTQAKVASAMSALQKFEQTKSLDELKASIAALFSATEIAVISPRDYVARRRALTKAWVLVLRQIEASYDPSFDPNNVNDLPRECLTPPREPDGTQMPSCTDPNDVKDPKARAEYLLALKQNQVKTERANAWAGLHNLDEYAMACFEMTLKSFASVVGPDPALDEIVRQGGLTHARTKTIEGWLGGPRSTTP